MAVSAESNKERPASHPRFNAWASIGTLLVVVLVVLVNYIAFRRYERWDITRDQLFTLSERTGAVLEKLEKPVQIYVFVSAREPTFQELQELIPRYKAKTDKLDVQYVDPDREPTKFKVLAEKYGVRVGLQENGQPEADLAALLVSGEKRWSITRDDLVDLDYDSLESQSESAQINVKTEQALTGAIVQVTSGRTTKVCATEGHGEWGLADGAERSLFVMQQELKRENVELESIATRGKSELPKACDAIFVLGPQKAFTQEESDALKAYLDGGGNLLLALDPILNGEELMPTGLEGLTEAYGLHLDNDVVVELDAERLLSPSPIEHFLVSNYSDAPLMKGLRALRTPVIMALARSIELSEGGKGEALVRSSDKAYGESSLAQLGAGDDLAPSEGDVRGPVTLAALVETRKGEGDESAKKSLGGRMVVVGDSDWLSAQMIMQPQLANVDLLSAFTGYLTEREALVAIAPRKVDAQAVMVTEEGLAAVFWRVVVLMPLSLFVLGLGVWWQRRQ